MSELSAAIAHELNQPLGAILANAEAAGLLLGCEPPRVEEARKALQEIRRDNARASAVIRRIAALYRGAEPGFAEVDINTLVKEVAKMLEAEAARRDIEVALDLDERIPAVRGDAVQLQQVLINLLRNAMDAIPAEGDVRRVILSTGHSEHSVRVAVSDSGVGIPEHARTRIFEPFYTTKNEGTGLGLAVSRRIVEAHNGRLHVSHSILGGAQLALELPMKEGL